MINRIMELGLEEAIKVTIAKNSHTDKDKIAYTLEAMYLETLTDLAKDYVTKKRMSKENALEQAAIDLKCNIPNILIKATLKLTQPTQSKNTSSPIYGIPEYYTDYENSGRRL